MIIFIVCIYKMLR